MQVFGAGVYGEQFDWAGAEAWPNAGRQVHDANIASTTDAQARAAAELRLTAVAADTGAVSAGVNCGQQLYDVVEITDPGAGLVRAKRRVTGVQVQYSRTGTARYDMTLNLGGV